MPRKSFVDGRRQSMGAGAGALVLVLMLTQVKRPLSIQRSSASLRRGTAPAGALGTDSEEME
jgi:hypothetical protein